MDYYRSHEQPDLAYPLVKEILPHEQDNQGFILNGGHVALKANDLDLCKELWEKASTMKDVNLAQKVCACTFKNLQSYFQYAKGGKKYQSNRSIFVKGREFCAAGCIILCRTFDRNFAATLISSCLLAAFRIQYYLLNRQLMAVDHFL